MSQIASFYMKAVSFLCLLLISQYALSSSVRSTDPLTMTIDEFYAVEKNRALYEQEQKNGNVDKIKNEFIHNCEAVKGKVRVELCKCYKEELDKVDNKQVFYTYLFYEAYSEASFNANLDGNEGEYVRLKKLNDSKYSYSLQIINACNS